VTTVVLRQLALNWLQSLPEAHGISTFPVRMGCFASFRLNGTCCNRIMVLPLEQFRLTSGTVLVETLSQSTQISYPFILVAIKRKIAA